MKRAGMKIEHDSENDLLYIYLGKGEHAETFELSDGVYVDVDEEGNVLGLEVISSEAFARWLEKPVKDRIKLDRRIRRDQQ